ncbi:MAG: hypothetical protein C4562_05840 [Actinobacteria bacterium]|nr:MAG: hypothetical protein C4562_05840 [Actinomycetota bacterium]
MIIDGHAHACGEFLVAENIIKILDNNKVEKVVLVPGELDSKKTYFLPDLGKWFPKKDVQSIVDVIIIKNVIPAVRATRHIDAGNQYLFSLAQKYPDQIIQFFWALLAKYNNLKELEKRFSDWKFRGIKLHQCWDAFTVNSEPFEIVARFAAKYNLPIFIHICSKKEVLALIDFIKRNPEIKFIIAHLVGLELYIQSGLKFENVYFDISPPKLISIYRLSKAIDYLGADKLILGSDTPYGKNNLETNIKRIENLQISENEKELMLGGNIKKLLNL